MAFTMGHTISSSPYAAEKEKVLLGRSTQQPLLKQDFADSLDGADDDSYHDSHSVFSSHLALSKGTRRVAKSAGSTKTDLPMDADARALAWILRTTGPEDGILGHGMTNKQPWPQSKGTFRLFSRGSKKRNHRDLVSAHNELNHVLHDEGGLLLPDILEQKVTMTGKRYIALRPKQGVNEDSESGCKNGDLSRPVMPLPRKSSLHDHHVSGFSTALIDDIPTADKYDKWLSENADGRNSPVSPISIYKTEMSSAPSTPATPPAKRMIAPPHYVPPLPKTIPAEPAYMHRSGLAQHPAREDASDTTDFDHAKYQVPKIRKPVTPMPNLALPEEEFPVRVPRMDKECDIKHPSPRRFASHPVLHRRSSLSDTVQTRSDNNSPATPPPKSPLRLRRDNRLVERPTDTICQLSISEQSLGAQPRENPGIATPEQYVRMPRITAVVTTQCTGPLSRTKSSDDQVNPATSRKDREERIRARKLRDRPLSLLRHADAALSAVHTSPQRRLHKARPRGIMASPRQETDVPSRESTSARHSISPRVRPGPLQLTTPELKPAPLNTKYSPAAATPSNRSSNLTVSTPVSLAYTGESVSMSPRSMMLVAEEVSLPKAKPPFRPAKIVVAKERVYTPRPRSASMPRSTPLRRSQTSIALPSRVLTPEMPKDESTTPPLPSPPPNRALPPTPPASGSEKLRKRSCKIPTPQRAPSGAAPALRADAGVIAQATGRQYTPQTKQSAKSEDDQLRARLEALESRNKLLEEAVLAMLNANGAASGFATAILKANLASHLVTSDGSDDAEANTVGGAEDKRTTTGA